MHGRTLDGLAAACGGEVSGSGSTEITGLAPLKRAGRGCLAVVDDRKWLGDAAESCASAFLISPNLRAEGALVERPLLVHQQPRFALLQISELFASTQRKAHVFDIHPTAVVHPSARLGENITVGPFAVVAADVNLSTGTSIGAHCVISERVSIGEDTMLAARVTVHEGCRIGRNCTINAGTILGANGFFFDRFDLGWQRLPSLASVVIGDSVEIGSNCTIDRGTFDDTVLSNGVKIDNLVQIAHDVQLGERAIVAACSGISGGTKIGSDCKIAGQVGIAGNLTIVPGTQIGGGTVVTRSIQRPGGYVGVIPFAEYSVWRENFSIVRHLKRLRDRIVRLEHAVGK